MNCPSTDILKTLSFLFAPSETHEVCLVSPYVKKSHLWGDEFAGGKKAIVAGWFKNKEQAAGVAAIVDNEVHPQAIYTTLNPVVPALLGRANHRLKVGVGRTQDSEVAQRCNLLIDLDPVRPAEISSTANEKAKAHERMTLIKDYLHGVRWPAPLVGDSGNGYHLIFKIDLPNNPEATGLVKGVLHALAEQFDNSAVKVDKGVFNAGRLTKIYGTTARKGDDTEDRPHRLARILELPEEAVPVTREQMEAVAALAEGVGRPKTVLKATVASERIDGNDDGPKLDVRSYLEEHGREVVKEKYIGNSTMFVLSECIFDPSHTAGDAAIVQRDDGMLSYFCFHNSCKDKWWCDARQIISGDAPIMPEQEQHRPHKDEVGGTGSGFFAKVDPAKYRASQFVNREPEPLMWLLPESLLMGVVGAICGPPGAGKSTFLLLLAAMVATSKALFGAYFKPGVSGTVLIIAAEEDERIIHRRLKWIYEKMFLNNFASLDQSESNYERDPASLAFKENIICIPAAGEDLRLMITRTNGIATPSQNFYDLLALVRRIDNLALIILDPLARLYGADENSNPQVTAFVSLAEKLTKETKATVLLNHHVSKRAALGDKGKFDLDNAMSADAIRGASALTGGVRFQANLFPLPPGAAKKYLGVKDAKHGQFLAFRVCKNNYAPEGEVVFFRREENGLLSLVDIAPNANLLADGFEAVQAKIIEVVTEREKKGEPALTLKLLKDTCPAKWKEDLPGVTKTVTEAAANMAIADGKLFLVSRKNPGNGKLANYLATKPDPEKSIGQTPPSVGNPPDNPPDRKSTGQSDSTGQNALSGGLPAPILEKSTGQESTGQRMSPGPGTSMVIDRTAGQYFPLKGEEVPSGDGILPPGLPLNSQPISQEGGDEAIL